MTIIRSSYSFVGPRATPTRRISPLLVSYGDIIYNSNRNQAFQLTLIFGVVSGFELEKYWQNALKTFV